jgi:hypothetical protein
VTVGLGVGLVVGAGFRPTAAAAQTGAATLSATARVLPAVGALPRDAEAAPGAGRTLLTPWHWASGGESRPVESSLPATLVTRHVRGNRRVIEVAAVGV